MLSGWRATKGATVGLPRAPLAWSVAVLSSSCQRPQGYYHPLRYGLAL